MSVLTSVEILAFITTVHMRHLSQCHWLEKALVSLHPYNHSKNNLNTILFSTHFLLPPHEGLVRLFRLVLNSRFKRAFCFSFQNSCGNSGPLFQGSSVLFDLLALSHSSSSQVFKWATNILYQNQMQTNQDHQAPTVSQNRPAMWNIICCSVNVGKQSGYDRK